MGRETVWEQYGQRKCGVGESGGTFRQWLFCSSWLEHYVPTGEDNACRLEDVLFTIQPRRSK